MIRWDTIVVGAVAGGAVALAGCASTRLGSSGPPGAPQASRPEVSPASAGGQASASARPGSAADIGLSSEPAPFTGDVVALTVQAWTAMGETQPARVASATVDLGDGTTAMVSGPCAGTSLPPPAKGLMIRHVYRQPGTITARVTAATVCGQAGQPNLLGSSDFLRVLPSAPASSASWPECGKDQVEIAANDMGAALGHVGVLFTLRNTSPASCRLYGYPGMLLAGSQGQPLTTNVVRAVNGSYLILKVAPHWVALPPGATASFDLEYGDNPVGAQANEPYAQACPAATSAEVTLPNATDHSVVPVSMAPCGGQVLVSPVVPGAHWVGH
jgi:hypothetical protein